MFKKIVSVILAFSVFTSSLVLNFEKERTTVYAGTTISSFDSSFGQSLSIGPTNGIPIYSGTNTVQDSAFFDFSLSKDPNGGVISTGKYVLSYPTTDGSTLNMTVDKTSDNSAVVTYEILKKDGTKPNDFQIYSYKSTKYEKPENFTPSNGNGSVEAGNYVVTSTVYNPLDSYDNGGAPSSPTFHIKPGTGFSFIYNGTYAHIKWDSASGEFQFFVNGMAKSNVYNVKLDFTSSSGTTIEDSVKILTGISTNIGTYQGHGQIGPNGQFISAPFANAKVDLSNNTSYTTDKYFSEDVVSGSSSSTSSAAASLTPGEQGNGIRFGFTAPMEFDTASNSYTKPIDPKDYDMELNMTIGGRQVKMSDVLGSMNVTVSGDKTTYLPSWETINSKGQFYVTLRNLPIGRIFENVTITTKIKDKSSSASGTSSNVAVGDTKIPFGTVFTFPQFSVVQINSKFYIELIPFLVNTQGEDRTQGGTYLLKTDGAPSVTQTSDGKEEAIYFPLENRGAGAVYQYQLFFNPASDSFPNLGDVVFNKYIHSEIYEYTFSEERGDLALPEGFVVNDYSLSNIPGHGSEEDMNLSLDMSWNVATVAQLQKMLDNSETSTEDGKGGEVKVKYSLSNYLTPSTDDPNKQTYAYVEMTIKRDDKGVVTVDYTIYEADDKGAETKNVIKEIKDVPLESEYKADADEEVYFADVSFTIPAKYKKNTDDGYDFIYPNIYFLTVDTVALDREDGSGKGYEKEIGSSNFESITLNDISEEEVPPPQNLAISDTTKTSFNLKWELSGEGLNQYLLGIYTPDELKDIANNIGDNSENVPAPAVIQNNLDAYYDIYICSYETYMKNQFSKYPLPDSILTGTPNRTNTSYVINGKNLAKPYEVHMQDVKVLDASGNVVETKNADTNGTGTLPIEKLRETNGVVKIEKFPIFNAESSTGNYNADVYSALQSVASTKSNIQDNLSVYGLDENTKYFVYADLVVENQESPEKRITISSKLSPLVGTTTLSDASEPDDKDKIPPAPSLKVIKTTLDSIQLSWDPVVVTNDKGESSRIEYDVISLQDIQMPDKYLPTRDSFSQTWSNYLPSGVTRKQGYRTNILDDPDTQKNILDYVPETKTFVDSKLAVLDPSIITFTEGGLTPNRVYFYYVRSVRIVEDENGNPTYSYSTWSRISGTTANVENPTNLTINTKYPTYEPKTEVVLNFDAPIMDASRLGVDFDFYYTIRKDGEEWSTPILMDANKLKSGASAYDPITKTTNFDYKVSNLESGTSYTFKVKIVDRGNGASSLYSNEARAKTDMDQDDYDDDTEIDNWVDYLIQLLMEVFNREYWITEDASGKREVVYREEKFPGVISSSTDNYVTLVKSEDNFVNTYYISGKSLEMLNNANKGLKIIYENTEFYLTPNALSDVLNGAKKDVNNDTTKDFYVKFTVSGRAGGVVNGETTLSDIVTIDVVLTGFKTTAKKFEYEAYSWLVAGIDTDEELKAVKEKIAKYIQDGKTNEELQQLLIDEVPELSEHFIENVDDLFHDYLAGTKYNYNIDKLDAQMLITLLNVDPNTNVNGYNYLNNNYILKTVNSFGSNRTMATFQTGIYVFTGKVLSLPGVDGLVYADNIKYLFNKYGLDSYLGSGSSFNLNAPLSGQMVMGSTAKLMGMDNLSDPVTFLKSKGINASERVARSTIKSGDMIYYLMKVYENKTGVKIDNVNITNYGITSNMQGLNNQNRKSIQVAAQIGLIKDPNFNANYEMKVADFIYYLNSLTELIKL